MEKITKEQLCEVLDFLRKLTDGDIDFNLNQDDSVTLFYRNYAGDFIYETIETNPRVAELKKDILDTEERLADLKEELAKLTQK